MPAQATKQWCWYVVINGRDRVNMVFADWVVGASKYVTGVPGVNVKKYANYNDSIECVQ